MSRSKFSTFIVQAFSHFKASILGILDAHLVEEKVSSIPRDGEHAPDQEETLQHQVGGEGIAEEMEDECEDKVFKIPDGVDEGVKDELNKGEDTKDHPVPQPGPRMLRGAMEDRLEGGEGGVTDTNQGPGHQRH